jgi:hypothetical protein
MNDDKWIREYPNGRGTLGLFKFSQTQTGNLYKGRDHLALCLCHAHLCLYMDMCQCLRPSLTLAAAYAVIVRRRWCVCVCVCVCLSRQDSCDLAAAAAIFVAYRGQPRYCCLTPPLRPPG